MSQAAAIAGRDPATILLLAVSKTFPAEAVQAAIASGQSAFGENYVQEGVAKVLAIRDWLARQEAVATAVPIDSTTVSHAYGVASPSSRSGPLLCPPAWHFIGPIQSNKSRLIAEHFDWVHTVNRFKIAERLSTQRPTNLPPLQVCVQVNISGEASKSGVIPTEALALAQAVAALPNLQLRGLMAIPEPAVTLEAQRQPFADLRALLQQLNANPILLEHLAKHGQPALDTLSMGMSSDLEAAVMEGATIVRVGSAIFGERSYAAGV
ncbi:YggS family pyridoxal phosphate-dependent enzyme [Ampullimonas aquatilis]|uniref:YggS family pyridoxal phosphate-dependent enzyme n=1 Tax=Ampullimonas aquatilis TaxID=1341549 RepID=UPI003C78C59E